MSNIFTHARKVGVYVSIFLVSFSVILTTHAYFPTTDSLPTNLTAANIIFHQRLDLTNMKDEIYARGIRKTVVERPDGEIFSRYPITLPLVSVPAFWIANFVYGVSNLDSIAMLDNHYVQTVGKFNAALYVSLSCVLMYMLVSRFYAHTITRLFLVGIFLLATPMFNTAAQGNWQHAPSVFFVLCGLVACVRRPTSLVNMCAAAMIWGFAAGLRMSNALYVTYALVWIWLHAHTIRALVQRTGAVAMAFAVGLLPQVIISHMYHIPGGYMYDFMRTIEVFHPYLIAQNALSILVSPNYGLFVYSPILLLAVGTCIMLLRGHNVVQRERSHLLSTVSVCIAHWLFASSWWVWTGGAALDARMLTEIMPLMVLLCGYPLVLLWRSHGARIIIVAVVLWSIFTHVITVYMLDLSWNDKYLIYGYPHQIRNAWFTSPTLLEYTLQGRVVRFVYMYRSNNAISRRTIGYALNRDGVTKIIDVIEPEFRVDDTGRSIK